jgi:hypothetical protein
MNAVPVVHETKDLASIQHLLAHRGNYTFCRGSLGSFLGLLRPWGTSAAAVAAAAVAAGGVVYWHVIHFSKTLNGKYLETPPSLDLHREVKIESKREVMFSFENSKIQTLLVTISFVTCVIGRFVLFRIWAFTE